MATIRPWQKPTAAQQPSSPTLQEIMDEELAVRLQDEEWVRLAALEDSDAFDIEDSEDEFEEKESVPTEEDEEEDYEDDYNLEEDGYTDDIENGKQFNSLRESMRRQIKLNGHRGSFVAKPRLDLGKNGSGTHESMFDEHTQAVLRKLVRKELVLTVKTRAYTGKAANVFYGVGIDKAAGQERGLALKIFKTNKGDVTKTMECDPSGRRYGLDYVKKSIRRHLKTQAEHEYKYLCRARSALEQGTVTETEEQLASTSRGARVPKPLILREHVLATEFVGLDGHLAPCLEDARLNGTQLCSVYTDLLRAIRRLYQRARLVHGNLSAASIRYHDNRCWIMGIGHAVEVGGENHLVFLTRDLDNLDSFFRSSGVPAVSKRHIGLLSVDIAKEYIVTESPEQLLRRFPALEPLLRD
ncbi:Atypical/RIO protein Kinase [Phytophthora palmivora]|uniref:non-specific serine/threonine protein kinase n=1 Tax=Phytophthora palmivora TaxID=4796 RepID=A0A2P4YPR1_9STRA|nr:Atypical/RIO protein Kinase [Phytophthora palmivora]